jgi:hypothetical protein
LSPGASLALPVDLIDLASVGVAATRPPILSR